MYVYINRQRAETDLIRTIKKKFEKKGGEKLTIIYGDWSEIYQMKHRISTQNIRLKRKIGEYFKVYNIDEFRTSCINSKTLERNENMYLPEIKSCVLLRGR